MVGIQRAGPLCASVLDRTRMASGLGQYVGNQKLLNDLLPQWDPVYHAEGIRGETCLTQNPWLYVLFCPLWPIASSELFKLGRKYWHSAERFLFYPRHWIYGYPGDQRHVLGYGTCKYISFQAI